MSASRLLVQKYGGSSVKDPSRIAAVAARIARDRAAGKEVVAGYVLGVVFGIALGAIVVGLVIPWLPWRRWGMRATLVLPALAVAVALTFTRSAWVGACAAAAVLLSLKDLRLTAVLPIVFAVFVALAPASVTQRFASIFDLKDPPEASYVG